MMVYIYAQLIGSVSALSLCIAIYELVTIERRRRRTKAWLLGLSTMCQKHPDLWTQIMKERK